MQLPAHSAIKQAGTCAKQSVSYRALKCVASWASLLCCKLTGRLFPERHMIKLSRHGMDAWA